MKRLNLSDADVWTGPLILVNASHPVRKDRKADELTALSAGEGGVLLDRQAAKMLERAMAFLGCGDEIVPVSGYRALDEQRAIYQDSLREHGAEFTRQYVALPGCSEHQSGLAVDLALNRAPIDFIRPDFPYDGICGQFRELAPLYGFIERYPAGRETVTGIAHEPWHFRYVGYPHSRIMAEKALTLEEYTDYVSGFPERGGHLRFGHSGHEFEIFHVPVAPGEETAVPVPDGTPWQVSGDNEDGVVVTLWRMGP